MLRISSGTAILPMSCSAESVVMREMSASVSVPQPPVSASLRSSRSVSVRTCSRCDPDSLLREPMTWLRMLTMALFVFSRSYTCFSTSCTSCLCRALSMSVLRTRRCAMAALNGRPMKSVAPRS